MRNPEAVSRIMNDLDMTPITAKLQMPKPEGRGWTEEQAAAAVMWYRRFLVLNLLDPELPNVPNGPIDEVWHLHILDTRKYARDCEEYFGFFLHHYPYFGLKGDAEERDAAFDDTNRRYQEHFGVDCTELIEVFPAEMQQDVHMVAQGQGCNHSGSGTGCGQRSVVARGQVCESGRNAPA